MFGLIGSFFRISIGSVRPYRLYRFSKVICLCAHAQNSPQIMTLTGKQTGVNATVCRQPGTGAITAKGVGNRFYETYLPALAGGIDLCYVTCMQRMV
jgi:hypothetical protein